MEVLERAINRISNGIYECNKVIAHWNGEKANKAVEGKKELEFILKVLKDSQWIPCNVSKPKDNSPVLVRAESKYSHNILTLKACYVAPKTHTTEEYEWIDSNVDGIYDEENDCFWVPECWYEDNAVDDNSNWILDGENGDYIILEWRPLPEPYKGDTDATK